MKKLGLVLILIVALSIIPTSAFKVDSIPFDEKEIDPTEETIILVDSDDSFDIVSEIKTEYYKGSQGYDRILRPDGTVFVESQRWSVEYLQGKNWKQIGIPYEVRTEEIGDEIKVTRYYTDYANTQIEVIYHHVYGESTKTDVVINSGADLVYRIVWELDGIKPGDVSYGENYVNFTGLNDWVTIDWNDAFDQYGNITTFEVNEQANGKKLDIIFNVGLIKQGEYLVLDPTIIDSFTNLTAATLWDKMEDNHPSDSALDSSSGQTFNATLGGFVLTRADFWLRKVGNPTGIANASLFAMTGTFGVNGSPTGVALSNSITQLDVSTITGGGGWINFTFPGDFTMVFNTTYCIVAKAPTIASGLINAANYFEMRKDAAPPTGHPGNTIFFRNGAWVGSAGDMIFVVSGIVPVIENVAVSSETINRDVSGWFNVTVNNTGGLTSLTTVDIQINTTGDAENFTLRYTQATTTFSEASDPSGIVDINAGISETTVINATLSTISFNFNMTGGESGLCDVRVTSIRGAINDTDLFPNEFLFSFFGWTDVGFLINSAGEFWGINDIMGNLATLITGLAGDFSIGITNFLGMIRQQLRLVYQIIGWFITNFTGMVTAVFAVWDGIADVLDGTSILATGVGNWWTFIALDEWIDGLYLGILILWIDSISNRGKTQGEITVFLADVNQLINLTSFFVSISLTVFTLVLNNVLTLFDAIMTVIPI